MRAGPGEYDGLPGYRQHGSMMRKIKKTAGRCAQIASRKGKNHKERLEKTYRILLKQSGSILRHAETVFLLASVEGQPAHVTSLGERLRDLIDVTKQVRTNAVRRVLRDETVPAIEKIHSIYERHTLMFKRGKAGKPVQFGRMVYVVEDAAGFLGDYHVLTPEEGEETIVIPRMESLQEQWEGEIESASFDRGYHTPDNQKRLAEIVENPCISQKGKAKDSDQSASFVEARKHHPGIDPSSVATKWMGAGSLICYHRSYWMGHDGVYEVPRVGFLGILLGCPAVLQAFVPFVFATAHLSPDALPEAKRRRQVLQQQLQKDFDRILDLVAGFGSLPLTPERMQEFEEDLVEATRDLGLEAIGFALSSLEPEEVADCPESVTSQGITYRRTHRKTTRRGGFATAFGKLDWKRLGYRDYTGKQAGTIFPLEIQLGLIEGFTPYLAGRTALQMARAGATQRGVLAWLVEEHGVKIGTERLRKLIQVAADELDKQRETAQTERLLDLLKLTDGSGGKRKPVLSVGRDGVTIGMLQRKGYETGSVATVSVYDREGERLGTVYLAQMPESLQGTLTGQIESLLRRVFTQWQGPLPRLCYVTDSGANEVRFFHRRLSRMRHPVTGKRLQWQRIVDFFHVMERVGKLAELLFPENKTQRARWRDRMSTLLKVPHGASRVLHSVGALAKQHTFSDDDSAALETARNYLKRRTCWMNYAEYKNLGMPIGSGVTEAACKTLFTQRMKLSGMRWMPAGGKVVLQLRAVLLSQVWDQAWRNNLNRMTVKSAALKG